MKYMLLYYLEEGYGGRSLAERRQIYQEQLALAEELTGRGEYVAGAPLHPVATATSVRVRDGKALVTDGPFAETREHLGGYMIVDVDDLDQAIAIAGRAPLARVGTVEIRPVREGPPPA